MDIHASPTTLPELEEFLSTFKVRFRRVSFRGRKKMRGEWCLVCLTHHLLKIWRDGCAPMAT